MAHHHNHGTSATASVVLDLGGGVGALVIYTGPHLLGRELEISPVGPGDAPDPTAVRTHAEVRQRAVQPRALYGALIPDLPAGRYTVWDSFIALSTVEVKDGAVAECDWPG